MHPDRNRAPSATQAFQKLGQAYACLSDPQSRANYDRFGSEEEFRRNQSSASFYRNDFDAQDIFRAFFGGAAGGGGGPNDLGDLLGGIF
jgi:DnaJ-class molecular chaperone